jgi:hypothetical protein
MHHARLPFLSWQNGRKTQFSQVAQKGQDTRRPEVSWNEA